jgi:8-oxo-dGTP pyrophosphatase MutT (NUDIX family)
MAEDACCSQVKQVVTCFLLQNSHILLLKRSQHVRTFKGKWAAVSGYIESDADHQSLTEIEEETGLLPTDVMLIKKGEPIEVENIQNRVRWVVHPYLYKVITDKPVRIDWEHVEFRWIDPDVLADFDMVPMLIETLSRVYSI